MARTSKKMVNFLQDADDIVRIVTGKRIPNLVARSLELFGDNIKKAAGAMEEPSLDPADPYNILQVRRDACDIVVRASYRSLVREVHPDTGEHPNPKRFQELTEAYNKIIDERKDKKGAS